MSVSEKSPIERQALLLANSFRHRSAFRVILESLIYGSIALVAFLGNLLVLYIVYKTPRLKNVSGLFVASLALSDIVMATFGAPPSLASLIKGHWVSTFEACQFQGFVVITTVAASLQTMALMSVDRYFRVVHPINHRIFFTMSRARLMSALVWILAMMYPVPYLVCGRKYIFHPGKFFCFHEVKMAFESCVIYICVCISLGTLSFCYYNVFKNLRLNRNRVKNLRKEFCSRHENERRVSSEDIKLTKTLFVTVLGYLICWTPVLIIDFVDMASDGWSLSREVYVMYTDIGLISSSLNPVIYGALNRTFRREYNNIFCFKWLSRQTESSHCEQTNSVSLLRTRHENQIAKLTGRSSKICAMQLEKV